MLHSAEHFQEHFLGRVSCVGGIGQDAIHQAVDGLMELADQPRVGLFRSGLQFRDDRRLLLRAPIALAKSPKVAAPAMTLMAHLVL